MLRPLGTGAYDAHITLEDVEDLGQLIDAGRTDHTAHLGDPGVMGGGHHGAVLFRVGDHAAELEDLKFPAPQGQPLLLVEYRAAILDLDGDGHDQHDGCGHDHGQRAEHDIHRPLYEPLGIGQAGALDKKQGGVEGGDAGCAAHHDVRDLGSHIGADTVAVAEFEDIVAGLGGQIRQDHRIVLHHLLADLVEALLNAHQMGHTVLIPALVHLQLQRHAAAAAVDHEHIMGCVEPVIDPGKAIDEHHAQHQVHRHQDQQRNGGDHMVGNEAQLEIGDKVDDEQADALGKGQLHHPQVAELETVGIGKQHQHQQRVYTHQHILAVELVGREDTFLITVTPDDIVCHRQHDDLQQTFRRTEDALGIFQAVFLSLTHTMIPHPYLNDVFW